MSEFQIPEPYQAYTDKYFLRTRQILEKEGIDPLVKLKVFARKGDTFSGGREAAHFLLKTLKSEDPESHLWVLPEGASYKSKEPLMVVEGRASKVVDKETIYLGILSGALSRSRGIQPPTYEEVYGRAKELVNILGEIPATYFGARHYHWSLDEMISKAALDAGFVSAATDIGAGTHGMKGVGTIPHFLVIAMASKYGVERATEEAAKAFHNHIDKEVPRIVLVDTFNREISDSIACADALGKDLYAVRIDTCGENIGEGSHYLLNERCVDPGYRIGKGVTLELTKNLRSALDYHGHGGVGIFLSSGFGNPDKLKAFVEESKEWQKWERSPLCRPLFKGVGIGEITEAIFTTADIFEVDGKRLSKTGREVEEIDYSRMIKAF